MCSILDLLSGLYRKYRVGYRKTVGSFVALLLGPWTGCQILSLWILKSSRYSHGSEDMFELPNLIFCSILFLLTVLMVANSDTNPRKDSYPLFALWVIFTVVTILAHWLCLCIHDKSGKTPESKSEMIVPYSIATAVLTLLVTFPICELVVESIHYRRRVRVRRQNLIRELMRTGPEDPDDPDKAMLEMARQSSQEAGREVVI